MSRPFVCSSARWPFLFAVLLIGRLPAAFAAEPAPSVRLVPAAGESPARFEATGFPDEQLAAVEGLQPQDPHWHRLLTLTVVVDGNAGQDLPPVAGNYARAGETIRFVPQFAPRPGLRYRATAYDAAGRTLVAADLGLPAPPPKEPTRVAAIFPSADTLPENLLRFYVRFSAPMSRGEVYDRVRLLDEGGGELDLPILEVGEELWDRDGTRLTLLLDPGRIKRGVKPRDDLGTALVAGKRFVLEIDRDWPDADGRPLAAPAKKAFAVAAPLRSALDPTAWQVAPPAAGTVDPLTVRFPRPLDRGLLEWTLFPEIAGRSVPGEIVVSDTEKTWVFRPARPWPAGPATLVIDPALEDPAGNRVGRAFEEPLPAAAPSSEPALAPVPYRLRVEIAGPREKGK